MNYTMKDEGILGSPFVVRRFYFDNGATPCFIEYRKGLTSSPFHVLNSASINTCEDLEAALHKCVEDTTFDALVEHAITKRFPNARKVDSYILNQSDKAAIDFVEDGELGFAAFHISPSAIQSSTDQCFVANLIMWMGRKPQSGNEWAEIDAAGVVTEQPKKPMLSFITHYINYVRDVNIGRIDYALRESFTLYDGN